MNIDSFIKTGNMHYLCEDYIITENESIPFVVISDGCSSSQNSDIGSRIISHTAKQYFKQQYNFCKNQENIGLNIIHSANTVRHILGVDPVALDATLLLAFLYQGIYHIYFFGDGFLFYKEKEKLTLIEIKYPSNAPYYLSYFLDDKRKDQYRNEFGNSPVIIKEYNTNGYSKREYSSDPFNHFSMMLNGDNIDFIGIASDGIGSFTNGFHEEKSPWEIINKFTCFKNINGHFLKRRVRRAVKELVKDNFTHYDDISIGVMLW